MSTALNDARARRVTRRRAAAVVGLSLLGGCICAVVHISLVHAFQPRFFIPRGGTFGGFLRDLPVAIQFGVMTGLVTAPFAYFCTLNRSLIRSFLFVLGIVLGVIVATTPFVFLLAFYDSLLALALGLGLCRILPPHWLVGSKRRPA